MHIDKYRVAVNMTEQHIISKLIFHRIIIPKFMKIRQLFYVRHFPYKLRKLIIEFLPYPKTYQKANLPN